MLKEMVKETHTVLYIRCHNPSHIFPLFRLNYVEQHAERMGFDQDKLDNARVAASRSSPMVWI